VGDGVDVRLVLSAKETRERNDPYIAAANEVTEHSPRANRW
jgi:hypothetical protein